MSKSGQELVEAVSYALSKANYLMLDSARIYKNEADAGLGVEKSGVKRENVFVVTKLFSTAVGRDGTIAEIEDSLKQFNIGYIDQCKNSF